MRSHIETRREVVIHGAKLTMCFALHVLPYGSDGSPFKASVTVWPRGKELPSDQKARWDPRLRAAGWYQACGRELRRQAFAANGRPAHGGGSVTSGRT